MRDAEQLRSAMSRRLLGRTVTSCQMRLPAVPSMIDDIQSLIYQSTDALGVTFTPEQKAQLRNILATQLSNAYAASERAEILISYEAPVGFTVNYTIEPRYSSLSETYDNWVSTRQPPYFGKNPDARVMAIAREFSAAAAAPVLDIGAGTGRNTLALAQLGHPVDAVEASSNFSAILREKALQESLPINVIERDIFSNHQGLRDDYSMVIVSEVTSDFRSTAQLRQMFEVAAEHLAVGGQLVFNIFLPRLGYAPDVAARQLGLQVYTSIFTYPEVAAAASGLSLALVADDSVYCYEQSHLAKSDWPPTSWYADWMCLICRGWSRPSSCVGSCIARQPSNC